MPGKIFATGLIDLALLKALPVSERYSYVYDGSAQVLDHMLINRKMGERLLKFGYARVDADFPVAWAGDDSRPERLSDHDAPVAFFSLDQRKQSSAPAKPGVSTPPSIQSATPLNQETPSARPAPSSMGQPAEPIRPATPLQ